MGIGISPETVAALRESRKGIGLVGSNLARAKDLTSSEITSEISTIVGGGRLLGLQSSLRRNDDPIATQAIISQCTVAGKAQTILNSLTQLETIMGTTGDATKSKLIASLDDFIGAATSLSQNTDLSVLQLFVSKGDALAKDISDISQKITDLRFQADQDIENSIIVANGIIKNLFDLNKKFGSNGAGVVNLYDQRDNLLKQLAVYCDIKISYGPLGQAYVSDARGSYPLVGSSSYGELNYQGVQSAQSLLQGAIAGPITLTSINAEGVRGAKFDVVTSNSNILSGGQLQAYRDLRDDILSQSQVAVTSLMKVVADQVNAVHNSFSTFPPKTVFSSSKQVSLSDFTSWEGSFTVQTMDANGRSIDGTSGIVRPVTVDLEHLPSALGTDGKPTAGDIIAELNAMLATAPSAPSLSLGVIAGANPPESLLNNIMLAGRSNIINGSFTFDLDLDGNNYFGSDVQVLSVTGPGGSSVIPDVFHMPKGAHVRTNQGITVNGLNVLGPNNIDIKIRVIGENGEVKEGTARFIIDPTQGTNMINKRVVGSTVGVAAPGAMAVGGPTHAPFATVNLVNEFGGNITDNFTKGNLVITSSANTGLLIQDDTSKDNGLGNALSPVNATGRGFGAYFGFNNFFEVNEITQTMNVRADIKADISQLSIGAPLPEISAPLVVNTGSVAADVTLAFAAGNLPVAGDTLTISGAALAGGEIPFTFGGGGARSVAIAPGNLQTTLQHLRDAINKDVDLSKIMTASLDAGGTTITITANQLGLDGNAFQVAANLGAGPATVSVNGAGAANIVAATNFINGASTNTVNVTVAHNNISNDSRQAMEAFAKLKDLALSVPATGIVPASTASLRGYATIVSSSVLNQVVKAKNVSQTEKSTLDQFTKSYREAHGNDPKDQQEKLIAWFEYQSANLSVIAFQKKIMEDFFSVFR